MIIVSDTSPISNLILIDKIEILEALFGEIIIPDAVHSEILALEKFQIDLSKYQSADWITILKPSDQNRVRQFEEILELDKGESEAIALALEKGAKLLLIDERLGTAAAKKEGLKTIGLLGCLIEAKNREIVSEIKPLLENLETSGFWISEKLKKLVLKRANEK